MKYDLITCIRVFFWRKCILCVTSICVLLIIT